MKPVLDVHIARIELDNKSCICFAADQNSYDHAISLQDLFTPVPKATRETNEVNDSAASARPTSPTVSIVPDIAVYTFLSACLYLYLVFS